MRGLQILGMLLLLASTAPGGSYPCGSVSEGMIRGRVLCMSIGRGAAPHDAWGQFALELKEDGTYSVAEAPGIKARSGKWSASSFQSDVAGDLYVIVRLTQFTDNRDCRLSLFPFSTADSDLGCDYEMEVEPRVEGNLQQGSYRVVDAAGECRPSGLWFFQQPPANVLVSTGGRLNLEMFASGAPEFSYSWLRDGIRLPQVQGASLVKTNADISDSGVYTLIATAGGHSITSRPVRVQINRPAPPVFVKEPASMSVLPGQTAWLEAVAAGDPPLRYQWLKDGVALPGQRSPVLKVESVREQDAGDYMVVVSSPLGSIVSPLAKLGVVNRSTAQILEPPLDMRVMAPGYAQFAVRVAGQGPFSYRWVVHTESAAETTETVEGPTDVSQSSYSLFVPSQGAPNRLVHVEVSNASGMVSSRVARLTIAYPQSPGQPDRSVTQGNEIPPVQSLIPLPGSGLLGQAGRLLVRVDPSGAANPWLTLDSEPAALLVQPDGRVVTAGAGDAGAWMRRFMPGSEPDKSFRLSRSLAGKATGIAWLPSWRFLAIGHFTSRQFPGKTFHLIRLALNGDWDDSYRPVFLNKQGTDEGVELHKIVALPDGRILVAGNFHQVDGQPRAFLVRLLAGGGVDPSFVPSEVSPGPIYDIALPVAGDNITIRGAFHTVEELYRTNFARLTDSGKLDPSFNASSVLGGIPLAQTQRNPMLGLADGKLAVATTGSRGVIRLNRDGSRDRAFLHVDVSNRVDCVAMDNQLGLWVGGEFESVQGHATRSVARLHTTVAEMTPPRLPFFIESVRVQRKGDGLGGYLFKGDSAFFGVKVFGAPLPVCEWLRDDTPIRQWGDQSLNTWDGLSRILVSGLRPEDSGEYRAVARNSLGSVTSAPVKVVITSEPFVVLRQPEGISGRSGGVADLKVQILSPRPVNFQWYMNGKPLGGQTNSQLHFAALSLADAGEYQVLMQSPGTTNAPLASLPAVVELSSGNASTPAAGPADLMPLDSLMVVKGVSKFKFKAEMGNRYAVQTRPVSGDGEWIPVITVAGDGKDHEVVVGKEGAVGIYRLVLVP